MAAATANPEKLATEAFVEGKKEQGRLMKLATALQMNENLEAANKKLERTITRLEEQPNTGQIGLTVATAAGGVFAGVKTNQALREYMRNKVDEKTQQPGMGTKIVTDCLPLALGATVAIAGAFSKSGMVAASMMGGGAGFAAGSLANTLFTERPKPLPPQQP